MMTKFKYVTTLLLCTILAVSCSKDDDKKEEEKTPEATLVEYSNIKFSTVEDETDSKRFFSTSEGKLYSLDDITEDIGPKIDLVWYDGSDSAGGFVFWDSPDDLFGDDTIPGATTSKMENTFDTIDTENFDAIADGADLDAYTVIHENEAMGNPEYPIVVLFQNAAGKKGAIKMKALTTDFLTVDIKVQK